jgi:ferric-dicitrate binding protein FerR (iron transport regulator)
MVVGAMKRFSSSRTNGLTRFASSFSMLQRRSYFPCLLFLAGIFVCTTAPGPFALGATPANNPAASATSITGKDAKLNGTPMPVGATLFPGDVIRLGEASSAGLRFGNSMVFAAPLTELVVESKGVSLRNGRLQVRADGAESFAISGPYFHVNISASEGVPSSAEVRLAGPHAQVSAVAGGADLTAAGNDTSYRVRAGETASLDASGAEASPAQGPSSPAAGQISRLSPQVQIDRASQVLVAAVSNRVYWNDDLRSGSTGRAHVTLNDGSQLNLGSDSSLRILQHDAQAQQTSLDLLVGRMRGKITKLTRPGAKFEVHTPVGIAGLVGTDFSLLVTSDYVELMVFEGAVRFSNLSGQSVNVTAGNMLRISKAGAFEGPSPTTAQDVQTAQNQTDITGAPSQSATPTAAATLSIVPVVVTLTGVGAAIGIGVWQGTRPTVSNTVP